MKYHIHLIISKLIITLIISKLTHVRINDAQWNIQVVLFTNLWIKLIKGEIKLDLSVKLLFIPKFSSNLLSVN